MSFLGCIGHIISGSGLEQVLESIYASNAVAHIFRKVHSEENGFLSRRQPVTVLVSFQSRSCLAFDISLFCSPELNWTPVNCCIM